MYIFDLDGTLADAEHRMHCIQGQKRDWDAFYAACTLDKPIMATIRIARLLCAHYDVRIWTGRSDVVYKQTAEWLARFLPEFDIDGLRMRKGRDFRADSVVKKEWYYALDEDEQRSILAIFEDRARVVQMWRSLGHTCYSVADGDF